MKNRVKIRFIKFGGRDNQCFLRKKEGEGERAVKNFFLWSNTCVCSVDKINTWRVFIEQFQKLRVYLRKITI